MFHDLPDVLEQLGEALDSYLADGLRPWAAVCELFVALIGRFEATDPQLPTQRINLWLNEPALRARYMAYVNQAEHVIADCLHRYRGTTPHEDDLPRLVAVAATGAYRVTIHTHTAGQPGRKLSKHLREALATMGDGLADEAAPQHRKRAARIA
jgi:hypothetical protein